MKSIIGALIVGVILFAVSASVSWYLMNQGVDPEVAEVEETDIETEAGVPKIGIAEAEKQEQMAIGLRPDIPLTVETVLELSNSVRKKEHELIEREQRVKKSERNVQLLFEDLKVERAELTALTAEIESRLKQARHSLTEMKVEKEQLNSKSTEIAQLQDQLSKKKEELSKLQKGGAAVGTFTGLDEIGQRVKTAKPWFEGLEVEQAALYLKEFADNGELEFAARLLKSLQKRKASKILAAFDDSAFVQQILSVLSGKSSDELGTDTANRDGLDRFRR